MLPARPRVGLLVPRFTVFDALLGPERVARLRARRARSRFHDARIELVVVAPAMAAPPSLGVAVLVDPSSPAVIWNAIGIEALAPDADQPSAIEHTTTVGCQMLSGALARIGAQVPVVSTGPDDAAGVARLRRAIEAVSAAAAVRGQASRDLRGVAVRFRPAAIAPLAAATGWIGAGVTHHPVLVPGRIGETLALVARAPGVRGIAA